MYVIVATASSTTATDTIVTADWSTPTILAQDGNIYEPGFSVPKILKFYESNGALSYSSSSLDFWLNKKENGVINRVPVSDYKVNIGFYGVYNGTVITQENFLTNILNASGYYSNDNNETVETTNLASVALTQNTNTNYKTFNFSDLLQYISENTDFNNFSNVFEESSGFLTIRYYSTSASDTYPTGTSGLLAQTLINFEFGTSEDMARFAITADTIQAAVVDSKLVFSSDGLKILNGGLKIAKIVDGDVADQQREITLLQYSDSSDGLEIIGSGTFTGTVNATNGSFTGTVNATSGTFTGTVNATDGSFDGRITSSAGTIGGFTIDAGRLTATQPSNAPLVLDSSTGTIFGGTIHLTDSAIIDDYIALGDARIYNPDVNDGLFISAGISNTEPIITILDNGIMTLGSLTLNGQTSTISGSNFSITPDISTFNNIVATGKIVTSVFETNKVQSVGGAMLFKPSYKVFSVSGSVITLDTDQPLSVANGDKLLLIDKDGSQLNGFYTVSSFDDTDKTITISETISAVELNSVIIIGTVGSLIIGVNSVTQTSLLQGRGFSISNFIQSDGEYTTELKAFLGDLSTLGIGLNGYGLYSDNVFLKGSLTTVFQEGSTSKYAGVNTLSEAYATLLSNDTSRIIFWAGSNDTTQTSIQNAPFQVTSNGSIYAAQGIFTGSVISETIISDSEIFGTDIYGARIIGWNGEQTSGLEIWDTSKGISFMKNKYTEVDIESFASGVEYYTYDNEEYTLVGENDTYSDSTTYYVKEDETTLSIVQDGISFPFLEEDNRYAIRINNNQVYFKGYSFEVEDLSFANGRILSLQNSNYWISVNKEITGYASGETITINTEANKAIFSAAEVNFEQPQFSCSGNVIYGDTLNYKKIIENDVTVGYDLYIGE